jgi:hypothetical protein
MLQNGRPGPAKTADSATSKVVFINERLAIRVPLFDRAKFLHVERYLRRQPGAAHNLGIPALEQLYERSYLALKLFRLELESQKETTQ